MGVTPLARAGEHLLAGRPVPDPHLLICADGGQVLAIGVEGEVGDAVVPEVTGDQRERRGIPAEPEGGGSKLNALGQAGLGRGGRKSRPVRFLRKPRSSGFLP